MPNFSAMTNAEIATWVSENCNCSLGSKTDAELATIATNGCPNSQFAAMTDQEIEDYIADNCGCQESECNDLPVSLTVTLSGFSNTAFTASPTLSTLSNWSELNGKSFTFTGMQQVFDGLDAPFGAGCYYDTTTTNQTLFTGVRTQSGSNTNLTFTTQGVVLAFVDSEWKFGFTADGSDGVFNLESHFIYFGVEDNTSPPAFPADLPPIAKGDIVGAHPARVRTGIQEVGNSSNQHKGTGIATVA